MSKKVILIIIAGILAMLSALAITRFQKKPEIIKPIQPVIEEHEKEVNPIQESAPIKISEPESKPVVSKPVKKVSYKKPQAQKPEATVQKVETPILKPIVVEEVEVAPTSNISVVQEIDSKDVVVIKECKIETPSRYSFK